MCNAIKESNSSSELPKQVIPRYVNKDVTFTYDIYFKDKTFNLPLVAHERPFKEVKFLDKKISKDGREWKIEKYEYKTCPECGGYLVALDRSRGERVCECGMTNKRVMLIADTELKWQGSKDKVRKKEEFLTYDELKVIKHIHKKAKQEGYNTAVGHIEANKKKKQGKKYKKEKIQIKTSQKDLNKKRYIMTVGTVASQLLMTKGQKQRVIEIIERFPLPIIHSRLNQQATIAGICRYILKQDGRGNELRYNRSAFQFAGLTEASYNIIERNLKGLGL